VLADPVNRAGQAALSTEHTGARLLMGLGGLGGQELLTTLVLAMAASVEAVRPDRSAPRNMKPAKIQGFHPNYKRCR